MTNDYIHSKQNKNRTVFVRFLCICILSFVPALAHGAEVINSFRSAIEVFPDGSFTVTERIEYSFDESRHGIFREIPLTHPEGSDSFFQKRVLEIELTDVRLDGEPVPHEIESTKNLFKVRIGDPDTTLEGVHEYAVVYTVRGGLWYPKDKPPELYFNVTGNGWDVPILSVEAMVYGKGLFRPERSCYSGEEGSEGSCVISASTDDTVQFRTVLPLDPHEGMTVAQALNHDLVAHDVRERFKALLLVIPLLLLGVLGAAWRTYRYKTEYKTDAPIIAQYEPYPGVKPMYAGVLLDRSLDAHDVTAGIVYLAREGYLKIRHTEKKVLFLFEVDDYELTLIRPIKELERTFESELLVMLFDDINAATGTKISLGDLKNNYSDQKQNYALLQKLRETLRHDLKTQGFVIGFDFSKILQKPFLISFGIIAVVLWFFASASLILLTFAGLIMLLVVADGRRTRKGYEALDHLKGFKEFLSVTDTERFAFHNAPTKNPEQFMEYLPYAIAFGVEKEWAEAFKDLTIPNPGWYEGGSTQSFAASNLSASLGAFGTALASSGATGSSGGGSSGGGSGGGGGGSW